MILHRYRFLCQIIWASGAVSIPFALSSAAAGRGGVELAHQLESEVDYFGVAVIEEAVELRRAGIKKPILILGYTSPSQDDLLINYDITQNIYTYDMAKRLSDRAVALGKTVRFHIGLDTGMSRVGFQDNDESVEQIKKIVKLPESRP